MSRLIGPIVVKQQGREPAPPKRDRRGRAGKYAPVYTAMFALRPGEWFAVPGVERMTPPERLQCVCCLRKYIRDHDLGDSVEVYCDERDAVIVRAT